MAKNVIRFGENRIDYIPAGDTITAGELVKLSSNTVVPATDGAAILGVAETSVSSGEFPTVTLAPCIVELSAAAGVNFNYGDIAYVATSTTLDAGSQSNISCGVILNNPVAAGVCKLYIQSELDTVTTHA